MDLEDQKKLTLATERKRNRNRRLSSFCSFKEICCDNQFTTAQPGTVATWCKPSSGASVVRMAILLRGWVQLPAMKNRDRLSNFTRALDQPEKCRTEESLKTLWSGAQGYEFVPRRCQKFFWPCFVFGILPTMFVLCTYAYYVSGVYIFICNVAACIWWHLLYLNFRNIDLGFAAIFKKRTRCI